MKSSHDLLYRLLIEILDSLSIDLID